VRRAAPEILLRNDAGEQEAVMVQAREEQLQGHAGTLHVSVWDNPDADRVVLLAHGYGEHIARYQHVADALVAGGSAVYGPDHVGHGRSAGDRVVVHDFERVVDDLHQVAELAQSEHPGLPVVLVGHSMGGMIAARYAQRYGDELAGLVLSGPAIGEMAVAALLDFDPIPEIAIDVDTLSRDPKVGADYAADPLVWHGAFKRPTVEAMLAAKQRIDEGPGFGDLPLLYVHGGDDQLVPLDATRPTVQRVGGSDVTERIYDGARHEVFNETNKDEVIGEVVAFVERVTSG
jgi:alpha-beta hydrolase superfamily lysophospholipase